MTHFLKDILSSVLSCFHQKKSFGMLSSGDSIYQISYGGTIEIPYVKRYKISSLNQCYNGEWRFKVEDGAIYIQESEMDKTIVHRKVLRFFVVTSIKDVKKIVRKNTKKRFIPIFLRFIISDYLDMKVALYGIK